MSDRRAPVALLCAGLCAVAACGASPSTPSADGGAPFVAFAADFAGFRSWTAHTVENGEAAGATHVSGRRTIYINQVPPAGATEFPVGTVIVKTTESDGKIFARAKRGGIFNSKGAVGWEWFELLETAQHEIVVKWRGVGPPLGEVYGGDPNAGCNQCHKLAAANDFVLAPGLMLAKGGVVDAGGAETTEDAGASETAEDAATDAGAGETSDTTDTMEPDAAHE